MTRVAPKVLFVYGTLMRGGRSPYARLLQARARFAGEAIAPGRLYHFGRFPGAVFDNETGTTVMGEAFALNSHAVLDRLDAYEGCRDGDPEPRLFQRTVIEIRMLRGGKTLSAWAYPLAARESCRPLIASGRFQVR